MTSALEGVPSFDVFCHLLIEFANPSLLFGTHLVFVVLNVGDIFGML